MRLPSSRFLFPTGYAAWRHLFFPSLLGGAFILSGCRSQPSRPPVSQTTTPTSQQTTPLAQTAAPTATTRPTSLAQKAPTKHKEGQIYTGVRTKRKVFALTFDDGPSPEWTPQILATLKEWHATATFFMVGSMVQAHPQSARLVQAAGYPIGNHTWRHPRKTHKPKEEVDRTDAILEKSLGIKSTLFRPPYGILNNGVAKVALEKGQNVIIWNTLGSDWDKGATAESIAANVLKRAKPGGIALLHDGGGKREETVAALPHIIDGLRKLGLRLVTVPELLEMGPPSYKLTASMPKKPSPAPTKAPKDKVAALKDKPTSSPAKSSSGIHPKGGAE